MKKYFVFYLILILSSISLFSQQPFGGGSGTVTDPYQIWEKIHFDELLDSAWSDAFKEPPQAFWKNQHYKLMQDIITPLTQSAGPGLFLHGNNKKVILALNVDETKNNYTTNPAFSGFFLLDSLIVDGYVNSKINAAGVSDGLYFDETVSHCINNAMVSSTGDHTLTASWRTSGIVGSNNGIVTHCINNGAITGVEQVGGIVGYSYYGDIYNCINTGKITATHSGYSITQGGVGGIVGYVARHIPNSVNVGDVVGQDMVGGILGRSLGGLTPPSITNCINYGYIKGNNTVGGIVGWPSNSNYHNCINTGVVEGTSDVGSIVGKE